MKLRWILFLVIWCGPLALAQQPQAPRVSYSPMRDAPAVPEETRTELVKWLTDFQNTVFRMRIQNFTETVNWREIVLSATPPGGEPLPEEKMERLVKAMELICARMLPQLKSFFVYDRVVVRRIDAQDDAATIVGRGYDADGAEFKARWWLRRLEGRWQLVDYENVTVSMRLSTLMSQALQVQPEAPTQMKEISGKLIRIGLAAENGDAETALELANELLKVKVPGGIREYLLLLKADLHMVDDETEEADAALAELEKVGSTNPAFYLLKAGRHQEEGEFEKCIAWIQKFGSAIGHDGDSWQMLSESHRELGQKAESLQTATDWLADYPDSSLAMYAYWAALPEPERVAKVRPLLSALPEVETLEGFASGGYLDDDAAALKLVIEVMKARKMPKETIEEWESSLEEMTAPKPEKGKGDPTKEP